MMLTGMHIAIIGGDARQLEVIRKLVELDAKLSLVGFDQLAHHFTGAMKLPIGEVDFADLDAIILPVHGTTLDGNVNSVFAHEPIPFTEEMVQKTAQQCTIYSGISNAYLDELVKKTGRKHVQLFERDDVAIYNSIPTAEGTVMMVIQHTDFTIHGSRVAVLGLGRVGMTVARTFAALGAKVKVGARRSEHLARITEMGLVPFHLNDLEKEVRDIDVCINTVPHLIVTASVIAKMPPHTLIIDLASKPGGTDFRYAEKRGVKAILAPGLPGVVAPKTAGQIIANVLAQLLYEDLQKREENHA
ncbi:MULTISPECIES: dipicolinic acid synthetase subunit A [Geobacillus]|uniref:Dipicolinate synthase subunit A n=1 Tax=Geobacillus proteiniphilus TaxID=860353 RepID=A0A1Q5T3V4_9BACL|nr:MULTISPECIES: dipicolinic acid synthetase subunit A [Geobacillus]KDE49580.1 dipicolinate synthase subunit A [Geobacillus sp. CAMR5420]OKO94874.1 Dipicolinate synthase subunit A [Geobacillus proteiniphilus]OPX03769.1 dipicolinic acid synthetase subunit A [Geobacillus sp. LEMMY01]WMJ18133.1 dipicolinic acid synthetase subunit A [Geobacillus proteiniphilus]